MKNILVIKQTSLGDVLHSTGHVRAIRDQYPDAHITLLTADTSADIYRDNPHVDQLIEFQRYTVKSDWYKRPLWVFRHFRDTFKAVNTRSYDLAIDLQGRWKSVIFLYAATASRKVVKGRWWGLQQFRNRQMHALNEMDGVLRTAGVIVNDHAMEFHCSQAVRASLQETLETLKLSSGQFVILSPYTRWASKNWSLQRYHELITQLQDDIAVVITGAASDREKVSQFLETNGLDRVVNLCGRLNLREFAELVRNARAMVSGDSFAMHVAAACQTPVVALFGSTDENKVGPVTPASIILRSPDCTRCYQRDCPRRCIDKISAAQVLDAMRAMDCLAPVGK